jgi:hypothetical protein
MALAWDKYKDKYDESKKEDRIKYLINFFVDYENTYYCYKRMIMTAGGDRPLSQSESIILRAHEYTFREYSKMKEEIPWLTNLISRVKILESGVENPEQLFSQFPIPSLGDIIMEFEKYADKVFPLIAYRDYLFEHSDEELLTS